MKVRNGLAVGFAAVLLLMTGSVAAADNISGGFVKIGVLTDMSGVYKAPTGPGSILGARMAVEKFGGTVLGKPIKLVSANHQNKASVASTIARKWIDQDGVDMITGMGNSAVGLAVQGLGSDKHTIIINTGAGSTQFTEGQCTKYGIHYVYTTRALAVGTATGIVNNGGDTWFFITADYAFGHSLQKNTAEVVKNLGAKVLGSVKHPLGATDFASYLLQAKSSGAEVIALANAGGDTVNAVKQADAFGIVQQGQQLAALNIFLTGVKALGLKTAEGLQFTRGFNWGRTEQTRAWSKRFYERHGAMPTDIQAGTYSAVLTYLKAIKKAGTDNADAVREVLGNMTINDMFVQGGDILPNGLMVHDMYLVQVKSPEASKGPWDLLKVVATIPGKKAFIPLSESSCPLLAE